MSFYEIEDKKNRIREMSIEVLDKIKSILIFYDTDIHNAKKWEKIKEKRGFRRWLFLKLTYDLYEGEPPAVEECHEKYKNLLSQYSKILNPLYWEVAAINDLLDFLSHKKAYNIHGAVGLYEEKKKRRI